MENHSRDNHAGMIFGILFWAGLIAAGLAAGCSNKNFDALKPGIETRGRYIEGVPFYPQNEYACGPAALKSVLTFWGHPVDLDTIVLKVYLPELRGSLPMDMENFAREAGFDTASSSGTLDELKSHIRNGIPVICLLDLGFGLYRKPHYISVLGFDDLNLVFIGHDGLKPNVLIPYEKFNQQWTRAGRWMLAIKPKSAGTRHEP